jgi:HTH-like domain
MSERQACRLVGLARSTNRYQAKKTARDAALRGRLKELAAKRMRFGYRRLTAMLVREGMTANHKRVYRLYREEGLAMRIRTRRQIRWRGPVISPAAGRPNERWSMDFLSDCVSTGRAIRMLTVVDDCTRECPAIEVDTSLGGAAGPSRSRPHCQPARIARSDCAGQRAGVSRSSLSRLERRTESAIGVHAARKTEFERCTAKNRNLEAGLQPATTT